MENIEDLRIKGIDEARPPILRKEPYINLYFELSSKAPKRWCSQFNDLVAKGAYPIKVEPKEGVFIETWVREANEIENVFKNLKAAVKNASKNYIAMLHAEANGGKPDKNADVSPAQQELNSIINRLDFDS